MTPHPSGNPSNNLDGVVKYVIPKNEIEGKRNTASGAYYGDPHLKERALTEMAEHKRLDQLVRGKYWNESEKRGCAIGCMAGVECTTESSHSFVERKLNIPRSILRVVDRLFEKLPNGEHLDWPLQFLDIIQPGADLSKVMNRFILRLLDDPIKGVLRYVDKEKFPDVYAVVSEAGDLYARRLDGQIIPREVWVKLNIDAYEARLRARKVVEEEEAAVAAAAAVVAAVVAAAVVAEAVVEAEEAVVEAAEAAAVVAAEAAEAAEAAAVVAAEVVAVEVEEVVAVEVEEVEAVVAAVEEVYQKYYGAHLLWERDLLLSLLKKTPMLVPGAR